jgi:hypothetical protein
VDGHNPEVLEALLPPISRRSEAVNDDVEPRIAKHRARIIVRGLVESLRVRRHEDGERREQLGDFTSSKFYIRFSSVVVLAGMSVALRDDAVE